MWLCGSVAKWLHWGNRRKVVGEPPAWATLTSLSSGLLEPQGKPGWGKTFPAPSKMAASVTKDATTTRRANI